MLLPLLNRLVSSRRLLSEKKHRYGEQVEVTDESVHPLNWTEMGSESGESSQFCQDLLSQEAKTL